jgi:uncharacterized protein (DUF885 family)
MERARKALEAEARAIDPTRTWRDIVDEAKARHPETNRLLDAYRSEVERAHRFVDEHQIAPIPGGALEVVETPVFHRGIVPYATYLPPAPFDDDQTGYFFVTPVDIGRPKTEQAERLREHATAAIPLVALHEGYPGRHLQMLHANRASTRLRQLADSSLFQKGWALYCEEMMDAQGFLTDRVTRVFRLRDLMWRACRVVLDCRLHAGTMTVDEAVAFLVEHALLERSTAESEVRRYTLTPTQPMSYIVGMREIVALRDETERRMGARFSLHEFHAGLLGAGSLPPALVRETLWERLKVTG